VSTSEGHNDRETVQVTQEGFPEKNYTGKGLKGRKERDRSDQKSVGRDDWLRSSRNNNIKEIERQQNKVDKHRRKMRKGGRPGQNGCGGVGKRRRSALNPGSITGGGGEGLKRRRSASKREGELEPKEFGAEGRGD